MVRALKCFEMRNEPELTRIETQKTGVSHSTHSRVAMPLGFGPANQNHSRLERRSQWATTMPCGETPTSELGKCSKQLDRKTHNIGEKDKPNTNQDSIDGHSKKVVVIFGVFV